MAKKKPNIILSRRLELGLSQETLAVKAKVSCSTIARMEHGRHKQTTKTLKAVARILKLPLAVLLENT